MASGEYRRQWHKYLSLAVPKYITTYHSSIGLEPSKLIHGGIPHNVLHYNLGNNPNKNFLPTTEFTEEVQKRTQTLIDQTKKNIMQSYLKNKDYYDRKAKAAPLKEKDSCFILQLKADSQASKIPFRDYRWIGPFVIQKNLSKDNYFVRRVNTNKTQIIHRIRLKKFVPNTLLQDNYPGEKLQPGEEKVIPQDDLYINSGEVEIDCEFNEKRKEDWTDLGTSLLSDAAKGGVDHYVIENERGSVNENEDCSERMNVGENEIRPAAVTRRPH